MRKPKNVKPPRKPSISIVGTGRLGTALALALDSADYPIASLVARSRQKVRKAAQLLDAPPEILAAKDLNRLELSEVVLVAVPDDQVGEVANRLARITTTQFPFVFHTSGALSSAVFTNLTKKGWHTGSIHPLVSISDPVKGVQLLRNAYWCIEGDRLATRLARQIVADIGGRSFSIPTKNKPLYHAAAVMSSGNVTALFDVALGMLEPCGLPRHKAQQVLLPLLESTTANLARAKPGEALTGTFARGDVSTLKLHLAALEEKKFDEALKIYRLLGNHSLRLARRKIPAEVFEEIKKLLR